MKCLIMIDLSISLCSRSPDMVNVAAYGMRRAEPRGRARNGTVTPPSQTKHFAADESKRLRPPRDPECSSIGLLFDLLRESTLPVLRHAL